MFVFQLVQDLLKSLPTLFEKTMETQSALGSALQAAFKLLSPTGGRMSVFQTQLPNLGVGALQSREDPNQRASAKVRALVERIVRDVREKGGGHHIVRLRSCIFYSYVV